MNAALPVLAAFLLVAFGLGLRARGGGEVSLEQWTVGGRGFGTLLVFVLMAGEIYTTFTFLGGSGWAYGRGAPAFYILCYGSLAYVGSYYLLPPIWRYGGAHKVVSQADYFASRYRSPALGVLVAIVGVVALVFYLVLQLKGLQIIVAETSYGAIGRGAAMAIGTVIVVLYVVVSGVRGSAWTAALKDLAILAVAVGLGVYLPLHHHGGFEAMFRGIERARPGFLVLPPRGQSQSWFLSTVGLTALGFYLWPHAFASTFTARSERVFRRNAALLPLYQLILLFVFFAGFAAVTVLPPLPGAESDLALLRLARHTFPPWLVGVVGGAGLLTALVPGSMILNAAATLLAKNVVGPLLARSRPLDDRGLTRLAQAMVPLVALAAIALTYARGDTIVVLLLMGYSMITQLAPALLARLGRGERVTAAGAIAGIVVGEVAVGWLTFSHTTLATLLPGWPSVLTDINVGLLALALNAAVMLAVSATVRPASPARDDRLAD